MNIKKKLKEIFKYRKHGNCHHLGDWYCGWHSWTFDWSVDECGYDEPNAELNLTLFGWFNKFTLPFKSKRFHYGDCDSPKWGILVHNNTLWIHHGGAGNGNGGSRYHSWDIPFFAKDNVRSEEECYKITEEAPGFAVAEDTEMVSWRKLEEEMRAKDGKWHSYRDNPRLCKHTYDFNDPYDGTPITATYWVYEQEWRRKWMHWTRLGSTVHRGIDVEFSDQVGEGKEDWKGGVTACGARLLPGETPEECIIRLVNDKSRFRS